MGTEAVEEAALWDLEQKLLLALRVKELLTRDDLAPVDGECRELWEKAKLRANRLLIRVLAAFVESESEVST